MAQINHAGSAAPSAVNGGRIVSASGVILPTKPMMGDGAVPEELTKEQIAEIVYLFGQAASRAMEAGYDAVELLEKNSADLVGIGRELLKNPHWADEQLNYRRI